MTAPDSGPPAGPAAFQTLAAWIRRRGGPAPFLLGIGGPGGCGKTTLAHWLAGNLADAIRLPLDDFRLPRATRRGRGLFGSHPEGNDLERLRACLQAARNGLPFERPVLDPITGAVDCLETVPPSRILLCDGEIAAHRGIRDEFDGLVLVEAHWRTQLDTRLSRDLNDRQFPLEKAIEVFLQSNLRDYPTFAEGAAAEADFILYRSRKNRFSITRRPPG